MEYAILYLSRGYTHRCVDFNAILQHCVNATSKPLPSHYGTKVGVF